MRANQSIPVASRTAILLVKLRVSDYETWKKVFDSMEPLRLEHGIAASTILRDVANSNVIVIINYALTIEGGEAPCRVAGSARCNGSSRDAGHARGQHP